MVKINGRCQRILAGLGKCWSIEVLDKAGSTVHMYPCEFILNNGASR